MTFVAEAVNRLAEYETFYSLTSKVMHSSSYKSHVAFDGGVVHFEPIRYLAELKKILSFTLPMVIRVYRETLEYYRRTELPAFGRKYREDWMDRIAAIKYVSYKKSEITII